MKSKYLYLLLMAAILLVSCSTKKTSQKTSGNTSSQSDYLPSYHISFKKGIPFGEDGKRIIGIRGWAGVVSDNKGRVYIPNYHTNAILVFDSTGHYITKMGGKGKGPGEYIHMSGMQITPNYLYVYASKLFKINVYSLDSLSYVYTIPLYRKNWVHVKRLKNSTIPIINHFFVANNGKILMGFYLVLDYKFANVSQSKLNKLNKNSFIKYYWLNQQGVVTGHNIFKQKGVKSFIVNSHGGKGITTFPLFEGKPLQTMSNKGIIAAAWSTQFNIKIYYPNGDLKTVIDPPFKNTPMTRQELIDRYDSIFGYPSPRLQTYQTMDLPDTWPALKKMLFDGKGRLWVAAIVPNFKVYKWFIFNTDGKLLTSFTWPRNKTIDYVNGGYMYVSIINKYFKVSRIVRYKINLKSSGEHPQKRRIEINSQ